MTNKYFATFALNHFIQEIKLFKTYAAVCARFEENMAVSNAPDFGHGWSVICGFGAIFSVEDHIWKHKVAFEQPKR